MKVYLIKPLKNPGKRYKICISMSLFKLVTSYRDFSVYIDGLNSIIQNIKYNLYFRLYVDKSVLEDTSFQKLLEKNIPNLEIYRYEDKRFLSEDGIHHDGVFGMMARFLALFDRKIKADYIWVSDVDLKLNQFNFSFLKKMEKTRSTIFYESYGCYNKVWIPETVDFPILNYKIVFKNGLYFPKSNFDNFLRDVYQGVYKDVVLKIKNKMLNSGQENKTVGVENFIYGLDEYYTNKVLFTEIVSHRRLIYNDINLYPFKYIEGISLNQEIEKKLVNEIKLNPFNLKFKKDLIKIYEDVYNQYVEKNLYDMDQNPRLVKCIENFNKYKNLIEPDAKNLVAHITVDPKTYRASLRKSKIKTSKLN